MQQKPAFHEDYARVDVVTPGSNRSFGIVMAAVFALLAMFNFWHAGRVWPWLTALAGVFLFSAVLRPVLLAPLNRAWFKFGMLLHKLVSPVVMGLLFYGAVLPTGLVMRALGKDLLRLKRQPDAQTYWIARPPQGSTPASMKDQF